MPDFDYDGLAAGLANGEVSWRPGSVPRVTTEEEVGFSPTLSSGVQPSPTGLPPGLSRAAGRGGPPSPSIPIVPSRGVTAGSSQASAAAAKVASARTVSTPVGVVDPFAAGVHLAPGREEDDVERPSAPIDRIASAANRASEGPSSGHNLHPPRRQEGGLLP